MKLNRLFLKHNTEFNRYTCNSLPESWGTSSNRPITFMCSGVWKERLTMSAIPSWKPNATNRTHVNFVT